MPRPARLDLRLCDGEEIAWLRKRSRALTPVQVTSRALGIVSGLSHGEISRMRTILLIAAMALICQTAAHATDSAAFKLAQASPADPAAQPAPAPQAAPAAAAPAAAAPDAAPPTAKATKPAKKRVAKRRNWEADEAKARSIAAKYGVSW